MNDGEKHTFVMDHTYVVDLANRELRDQDLDRKVMDLDDKMTEMYHHNRDKFYQKVKERTLQEV